MKLYFFIFLFAFTISASSQKDTEKILWKQNVLTWADFRGQPDEDSNFDANTNAGLSFSWGVKNDNGKIELSYEVISYFNPSLSWVKLERDDYLLKHEQLHFDITELHARKLRKKLAEVKPDILSGDPKSILTRIYEGVEKERTIMQAKFDKESKHSMDKDGENRWRHYVKTELLKYDEEIS